MKTLFVKKLYLWPRFHMTVTASLKDNNIDLVELKQTMTTGLAGVCVCMYVCECVCMCVSVRVYAWLVRAFLSLSRSPSIISPFFLFYFLLFFRGVLSKTETQKNALFDESRRCVCVCVLIFGFLI